MNKEYKYRYWHKIIAVSEEYKKKNPEIKIGMLCGRKDKWEYGVCIMDLKEGIEYKSAYTLKYIGRLLSDATNQEITDLYSKWKIKEHIKRENDKE